MTPELRKAIDDLLLNVYTRVGQVYLTKAADVVRVHLAIHDRREAEFEAGYEAAARIVDEEFARVFGK
jgi:hypothetical protein